jgi:hypothetical protein
MIEIPPQLQKKNFRFIKLLPNTKQPYEKGWNKNNNYSFEETDKNLNSYAVLCGCAGLFVLDFDNKEFQDRISPLLPDTFVVKTAGKRLNHYYYIAMYDQIKTANIVNDGKTLMDIRGVGSCVVGPSSVMYDRKYEIINNVELAVVDFDNLMVRIASQIPEYIENNKWIKNLFQTNNSSTIERIKTIYSCAQLLLDEGYTPSEHIHCVLHKPDKHPSAGVIDDGKVYNCFVCGGGDVFWLYMKLHKCDFGTALRVLQEKCGITVESNNTKELFHIDVLQDLMNSDIPSPAWLVENLIPVSGITFFVSPPGEFKSWLSMDLTIDCHEGLPFLGMLETKKCNVLYIDEENGKPRLKKRFQRIIKGKNITDQIVNVRTAVFNNIKIDQYNWLRELSSAIKTHKIDLVVLDSMVRCMDGNENDASEVREIFHGIKKYIWTENPNVSFLILHHTVKAQGNNLQSVRGSGDFAGFADVVVMFNKRKDDSIALKIVKGRDISSKEYVVYIDGKETDDYIKFRCIVDNIIGQDAETRCINFMTKYLVDNDIKDFKTQDISSIMFQSGHHKNTIHSALNKLCVLGCLKKHKKGLYIVNTQKLGDYNLIGLT